MNLIFHQFRKDIRQFRVYLALWFGGLALELGANLGWVGRVVYSKNHGFEGAANVWAAILPYLLWGYQCVLASLLVLADSPARRDGFLGTRPLPKSDLFWAKALFIAALILLPSALQETLNLTAHSLPGWVIARGTFERLLFSVPAVAACAGFAALWPDAARWARAIGIVLGILVLWGLVDSIAAQFFHWRFLEGDGPVKAHGLVDLYSLAIVMVGLAVWHSMACRTARLRWTVFLTIVITTQCAASYVPWDFFPLRPSDPRAAETIVRQSGWSAPAQSIDFERITEVGLNKPFSLKVKPKMTNIPPGATVQWVGKDAKLERVGDGEITGDKDIYYPPLFSSYEWGGLFGRADVWAWAGQFPDDVLFHTTMLTDFAEGAGLGTFYEPANTEELAVPVTLEAALEARVYRWQKLADLPLETSATATNGLTTFEFVAANFDHPQIKKIFVKCNQVELATAPDSRLSTAEDGPTSRMAFLVFDPSHNVVGIPDRQDTATQRGVGSAFRQCFINLEWDRGWVAGDLAQCRLIIFEKTWVGSVPKRWKSDPFTLAEKMNVGGTAMAESGARIDNDEFRRRMASVRAPAPNAPRRDVAVYFAEILPVITLHERGYNTNEAVTEDIARYLPAHLDILLDGLPAMSGAGYYTVMNAIIKGATEGQKSLIIGALAQKPDLAKVLLARGWVEQARTQLEQLLESGKALPPSAMRAIVKLRDEHTYPLLLARFEENPTAEDASILRTVPELAPRLDAVIRHHWREARLVWEEPGFIRVQDAFEMAMQEGDRDALRWLYQVLNCPEFDQSKEFSSELQYPLRRSVEAPGLNTKKRGDEIIAWMRQHRPDDFVFDPAQRKFALK